MDKESIYRIIGYQGEYNDNVKKAIRKLLKNNHPDNDGNQKVFELINEVKKELEEDRVSFDYKHNKSISVEYEDIDYTYCKQMIELINNEINKYMNELESKKKLLMNYNIEYNELYKQSIDMETYLLVNSNNLNKLKKAKLISIITLILSIIVFIVSVLINKVYVLYVFILLVFICIITVHNSFYTVQKLTDNSHNKIKGYVETNNHVRQIVEEKRKIKSDIFLLEKKLNSLANDLRFYDNILSNKDLK